MKYDKHLGIHSTTRTLTAKTAKTAKPKRTYSNTATAARFLLRRKQYRAMQINH